MKQQIRTQDLEFIVGKICKKLGKIEDKNLNIFSKMVVNRLLKKEMSNCGQSCVDAMIDFVIFLKEKLIHSQNLSLDFSMYFGHLILNRRIFEVWTVLNIADLGIPVAPGAKLVDNSGEFDFVAFYEDSILVGDVTTSPNIDEIEEKSRKLKQLEEQYFKPVLIRMVDKDQLFMENDNSDYILELKLGDELSTDAFKRKFLKIITEICL